LVLERFPSALLPPRRASMLSHMPSRDWDDSWYDDDEFPPLSNKRGRGGLVAVAVVTFVMCAFNALCSSCLLFCGAVFAAVERGNNGNFFPQHLMEHAAFVLLGFGMTSAAAFALQIAAGIGLLNSKRWARTLSFYLGGYSILVTFFLIYLIATTVTNQAGAPDDIIGQAIFWSLGLACHAGYAATVFLVLLNSRVASSLR
jgi:hypothetical protein